MTFIARYNVIRDPAKLSAFDLNSNVSRYVGEYLTMVEPLNNYYCNKNYKSKRCRAVHMVNLFVMWHLYFC